MEIIGGIIGIIFFIVILSFLPSLWAKSGTWFARSIQKLDHEYEEEKKRIKSEYDEQMKRIQSDDKDKEGKGK